MVECVNVGEGGFSSQQKGGVGASKLPSSQFSTSQSPRLDGFWLTAWPHAKRASRLQATSLARVSM